MARADTSSVRLQTPLWSLLTAALAFAVTYALVRSPASPSAAGREAAPEEPPAAVAGDPHEDDSGRGAAEPRPTEWNEPLRDRLRRVTGLSFGGLTPRERARLLDELAERRRLRVEVDRLQAARDRLQLRLESLEAGDEASLEDLARWGELRFRISDVAMHARKLSPNLAHELELTDAEVASVEGAIHEQAAVLRAELEAIHAELSGDEWASDSLPMDTLVQSIRELAPPSELDAAIRRAAQERAGWLPPPDDRAAGTAAERAMRAIASQEKGLRQALSELLGEELAEKVLSHPEMKGVSFRLRSGADGG